VVVVEGWIQRKQRGLGPDVLITSGDVFKESWIMAHDSSRPIAATGRALRRGQTFHCVWKSEDGDAMSAVRSLVPAGKPDPTLIAGGEDSRVKSGWNLETALVTIQ
jgi:hypothetical protein